MGRHLAVCSLLGNKPTVSILDLTVPLLEVTFLKLVRLELFKAGQIAFHPVDILRPFERLEHGPFDKLPHSHVLGRGGNANPSLEIRGNIKR
jgi:hypothetical protein